MLTIHGMTDIGRRKQNEDYYLIDPDLGLAIVADGMGGYTGGDVASRVASETIQAEFSAGSALADALSSAHRAVKQLSEDQYDGATMGCAIIAAVFSGGDYEICWVGDCRAYLWVGPLIQITRDHTYVESLLSLGAITWEEAETRGDRNLITQAIGASEEALDISALQGSLARGEELLLCSDGLNHALNGQTIAAILNNGNSTERRCEKLITTAVTAGADDNVTAVLITPNSGLPEGLGRRPAPVSIAGLDGSFEYFPALEAAPQVEARQQPAEPGPPSLDEELVPHRDSHIPEYAVSRTRSRPLGWEFIRYVAVGPGIGAAIVGLLVIRRLIVGS